MSGIIKATNLEVTTIKDKTNTNTAMTIDSSGRVAIPKVPAFKCRGFGSLQDGATVNGISIQSGTDIIYNWDVVDINRDNAFNNSTGIYTVPVAGLYFVSAGHGYKSSTNYLAFHLFLTSSDSAANGNISVWTENTNQSAGRHLGTIVEASVGQQFALGMSDQYSTPSTTTHYSWFSGYMVG
tara:strand:+ start:365 stop:910 length:546 start_codon:yes stop_codon:yes gene_type:complete